MGELVNSISQGVIKAKCIEKMTSIEVSLFLIELRNLLWDNHKQGIKSRVITDVSAIDVDCIKEVEAKVAEGIINNKTKIIKSAMYGFTYGDPRKEIIQQAIERSDRKDIRLFDTEAEALFWVNL